MIPASRRSDLDLDSESVYMEPNSVEISRNSWEVEFANSKNGIGMRNNRTEITCANHIYIRLFFSNLNQSAVTWIK